MLNSAFAQLLQIYKRRMDFQRADGATTEIYASPSNYFRNFQSASDIVVPGREFVITKAEFDKLGITKVRRGDVLIDDDEGVLAVDEIRPLYGLGGAILGYRIRTS